jgi:hypothetical protein
MQYAWDNSLHLGEEELTLVKALLRETANKNPEIASAAMTKLAKAVELPLRKGFFIGDTVGSIYMREDLEPGTSAKYPLDFVGPSGEAGFGAFKIADEGAIPDRLVKGTEVAVDTFELGNGISWKLQYARDARWPMVERALKVFRDGFVKTVNDEGWRVILSAIGNRVDTQFATVTGAAFTLGLLSDMQLRMKRGTDYSRNELTDLYVSSEVMKDIRDFATETSIDFLTRREIFQAVPRPDGNGGEIIMPSIYGVRIHEMKQLGVGREYNTTFNSLKGSHLSTFAASTDEVVVGLDLTPEGRQQFVMPVRRDMEMFEDPTLHRQQKAGVYGWMELAFALLDDRRALAGWIDV